MMQDEAETRKHQVYELADISRFDTDHKRFVITHYEALQTHRLGGRYDDNVVVYKAREQHPLRAYQVGYAWRRFSPRAEIVTIDGDHVTMMSKQSESAIAKDLARDLQTRILRLAKSNRRPWRRSKRFLLGTANQLKTAAMDPTRRRQASAVINRPGSRSRSDVHVQ